MRKYFLELFAIGLVDSEGRINTEHMTSDALMTSMKTMEELTKMTVSYTHLADQWGSCAYTSGQEPFAESRV